MHRSGQAPIPNEQPLDARWDFCYADGFGERAEARDQAMYYAGTKLVTEVSLVNKPAVDMMEAAIAICGLTLKRLGFELQQPESTQEHEARIRTTIQNIVALHNWQILNAMPEFKISFQTDEDLHIHTIPVNYPKSVAELRSGDKEVLREKMATYCPAVERVRLIASAYKESLRLGCRERQRPMPAPFPITLRQALDLQ